MARPSKSQERRQQILDAFERVILREGYANTSQRKVALEAGINQPMLHHYFEGGDDMLQALLDRVVERYQSALDDFLSQEKSGDFESILRFITSADFHQVSRQNEVFFALIGQGGHREEVFEKMSAVYRTFHQVLSDSLVANHAASPNELAYLIMCFVIGHDWAKKLGFGEGNNALVSKALCSLADNFSS